MTDLAPALPGSLREGVRLELRRAFHPPYEMPVVVAVNGLLMAGCWFLLPESWQNWLFTLHGPVAFAMVLAGWMYSDVPSTNVLAPDRAWAIAALGDPAALRRLLYSKNLTLWLLVAPLCTVVAIGIGIHDHNWPPTLLSIAMIAVVPLGALGISAWVGIRFPYHPIALARRWEQRRSWKHMLARWTALVLTPYGLVPFVSVVLIAPSILLWNFISPNGLSSRLSDADVRVGCAARDGDRADGVLRRPPARRPLGAAAPGHVGRGTWPTPTSGSQLG